MVSSGGSIGDCLIQNAKGLGKPVAIIFTFAQSNITQEVLSLRLSTFVVFEHFLTMKISTAFSAIVFLVLVSIGSVAANPSFPRATIVGEPSASFDASGHYQFGSAVDISADGSRLAVGADNGGQVLLYEPILSSTGAGEDLAWNLIWSLSGSPGETIGDRLSLSCDGQYVAVRRYNKTLFGDVEVYRYDASTGTTSIVGGPVNACGDSKGKAVKLVKTEGDSNSTFGTTTWLLASCESFDKNRGKVEILRYDDATDSFTPFTAIEGENRGSSFGWAIGAILSRNQGFLQVAVSSPNLDSRRGMVEAFNCNQAGACAKFGDAILGDEEGDQLGFSMAMSSSAGKPLLLVGAPRSAGGGVGRGSVKLYGWSSGDWDMIDEPLNGINDNNRFGRALAVSKNGRHFAISSIHHDRQTGLVRLYEVDEVDNVTHMADLAGEARLSQFGYSVSFDETGAVLAVGSPRSKTVDGQSVGGVQVLGTSLTTDAPPLLPLPPSPKGDDSSSDDSSDAPSDIPSDSPSEVPSGLPSYTPSLHLSAAPSLRPSSAPSLRPSASISAQPSDNSVLLLPEEPSATPSSFPSISPSTKPSSPPSSASMSPSMSSMDNSMVPSSPPSQLGTDTGVGSSSAPQNRPMIVAAFVATIAILGATMT